MKQILLRSRLNGEDFKIGVTLAITDVVLFETERDPVIREAVKEEARRMRRRHLPAKSADAPSLQWVESWSLRTITPDKPIDEVPLPLW